MNEKNENVGKDNTPEASRSALPPVRSPSRRRLIKLGAAGVPVVATLASSPAMAWNCRAPSAWGSNMTNVFTASQKANPAHQGKIDETFRVRDWANNTVRSATTFTDKPWTLLANKCPNLLNGLTGTPQDRWTLVTLSTLVSSTGITAPAGANTSATVRSILLGSDDFASAIITAQLNAKFPTTVNQMTTCINVRSINQLPLMAGGTYTPSTGGKPWDRSMIVNYLRANYMASIV